MTHRGLSVAGALLIGGLGILTSGGPAAAQSPPGGTDRASCREVFTTGPVLHAICRRFDGSWRPTRLYVPRCGGVESGDTDGALGCGG